MKKIQLPFKYLFLALLLCCFGRSAYATQKDTIPPTFLSICGDTLPIQLGSVWVENILPGVIDNQSDSAHITIKLSWGGSGPPNTPIRGIYARIIEATDSNGNKSKCIFYYKIDDFIPPIIQLNTKDTICHLVNTPYNAVAPTASDNFYPNSQVSLVLLSSNVNVNVIGLYEERYQATDGSGNKTIKIRYVNVSDKCSPANIKHITSAYFSIYPNPANEVITVDFFNGYQASEVKIISPDGKLVYSSTFSGQLKIDVSSFSSGVYTLQLANGQYVLNNKLVVQH